MVDRYCIDSGERPQGDMLMRNEHGPLVRWTDYDALAARLAVLEQDNAAHVARCYAAEARLAEAERLLRYWTPDETMVKPEHSAEWDRTVKWLAVSADLLCTTCGAKSSVYTRVRCNRPNCPTQTASGGES